MRRGFSAIFLIIIVLIFLLAGFLAITSKKSPLLTNKTEEMQQTNITDSYACNLPTPPITPIDKELFDKYNACKPISIFLKEDIQEENVNSFVQELKGMAAVKAVEYISKEKALETYKERNKDEPLLLESAPNGAFPASIYVVIKDPAEREKILNLAKSKTFVTQAI